MEFGPTWGDNGNLEDDFEDMMMTLGIPFHFGDIARIMKDCDWFQVGSFGPHTFDKGAPLVGLYYGYLMYLDGVFYNTLLCNLEDVLFPP